MFVRDESEIGLVKKAVVHSESKRTRQRGVMIHVGGKYIAADGNTHTTGSEGCFTLSGKDAGNKGITQFVQDITNRQKEDKKANKGTSVDLTIQKRDDVKQNWEVDKTGK